MKGYLITTCSLKGFAFALVLGMGCTASYGQAAKLTTVQKQAEQLGNLFAEASKGKENAQGEAQFFAAFPASFTQLVSLYGFDDSGDSTIYNPLYSSAEHIKLFNNLATIPEREYFEKYVRIAQNGYWQAGNISTFQHGMNMKVMANIKLFVDILQTKKEKEVRSFFRFLFDGPQPNNPIALMNYQKMFGKVEKIDPDIANLLREEYQALVIEAGGTAGN